MPKTNHAPKSTCIWKISIHTYYKNQHVTSRFGQVINPVRHRRTFLSNHNMMASLAKHLFLAVCLLSKSQLHGWQFRWHKNQQLKYRYFITYLPCPRQAGQPNALFECVGLSCESLLTLFFCHFVYSQGSVGGWMNGLSKSRANFVAFSHHAAVWQAYSCRERGYIRWLRYARLPTLTVSR